MFFSGSRQQPVGGRQDAGLVVCCRTLVDRAFGLLGRHRALAEQFTRFSVVGGIVTVVDFSTYVALTRGTAFFGRHLLTSAAIAFSVALTSSFILNTFWTFRAGRDRWLSRAPSFFAVGLIGIAINMAVLSLLISGGVYDLLAKVFAILVSLVWNFTGQRRLTFRS